MTPIEIEICLHYYYNPEPHRLENHHNTEIIDRLLRKNLIQESNLLYPNSKYILTDRGNQYVESLKRIPLPVKVERWVTNYPENKEYEATNIP